MNIILPTIDVKALLLAVDPPPCHLFKVTFTSRTLSVKEIPLMIKFIKRKDRQFPKQKTKKL